MTTPPPAPMLRRLRARMIVVVGVVLGLLLAAAGASTLAKGPVQEAVAADPPRLVVTWGAAQFTIADPPAVAGRTIRNLVHTSVGGSGVRISLSNAYGSRPVTFDAVRVALAAAGAAVVPGSSHRLSFNDRTSVTIPAGQKVLSDPLDWELPADATLAISVHVVNDPGVVTGHRLAMQTSYLSDPGDATDNQNGAAFTTTVANWHWVEAVLVEAQDGMSTVVFLGDSITDGHSSTPGENQRWPDQFAERIATTPYGQQYAILNKGISANKVLANGTGESMLRRFDRDVLDQPGVGTVVILAGINDILFDEATKPAHLIKAYRALIQRAHDRGICIVASTLTPFGQSNRWTPAREKVRAAVNEWIRSSGEFDATIDFDAAVRDPDDPTVFRSGYAAPDQLHPTDTGYAAMAKSVDPSLLRCSR